MAVEGPPAGRTAGIYGSMKQTTQQRKALCLLNFSGRYGGAEKRFATLFRYLLDHSFDFRLIINDQLYQIFIDNGVLVPDPRIVVFHDRGIFRVYRDPPPGECGIC